MSKSLNLLAVLSLYLISTGTAHALSCRSGDSSCSGQSATDCTSLGYSTANVNNCKHYLYCPFNINYKTCVAFSEIDCSDYPLTSCPKNGICKNCPDDSSYKKFTGCNSGYAMNSTKTGCELLPCSNGYARKADNCGIQGSDGWTLGSNKDSSGCYKCTIKSCPTGYSDDVTSTSCKADEEYSSSGFAGNNACGKCTSVCSAGYTYGLTADKCGTTGEKGWNVTTDAKGCGKCTEKSCGGDPKILSVNDCGTSGDKGWNYSSCYYGDELRGSCHAKECPAGSQTTHCGSGYTETATEYYSGNSRCYSCKEITCPTGYDKTIQNASQCSTTSANGWIVETKDGCGKCTKKTCENYGLSATKGELFRAQTVDIGDNKATCYDNVRCEDVYGYYPQNMTCYIWCNDYADQDGRYTISKEKQMFVNGKRYTGTCTFVAHGSGNCCCSGGKVDLTECL